ncbi:nucleotidyltransferase [Corynebacterium sp. P7003]|uniref:Nucleotidyltransferase n=1 Tax=Corynebacterium pygosceleis TaxID=2800406 RepID=A0ABT3WRJ8_9CORY|nr:nucleotidyltransferase [Corynebacterium pygosceleis]MCX7444398.1 nucleotidyltransferase [Corynebacterium pygosceleis]
MTTVVQWLDELNRYYTPSAAQFDGARSHKAAIESRLDFYIGVWEMFEIGSLRHGTGIWLYSDADYLASLKGIRPDSPWTMLNSVKKQLQIRFPNTKVVIRRPAVVCKFSEGDVEVVPGYAASIGYWIANPADGWMLTHPKEHNKYVTDVNSKHRGAVKKLARQVKIWKYRRNVPVSSCYLEMRTTKYMDGETTYLPLWDLYLTLKKMRDTELSAMNDPTGLGSRFGSCSSEANRLDSMSKINTAVNRALKAKDYAADGYESLAIEQLELLFNI